MVEPHGLQREGDVGVNTRARRDSSPAEKRPRGNDSRDGGLGMTAKSPRARNNRRAPWATTDRRQGRGTERAVGKYDSFPMDAMTERGYFAEQMEILAKT
jgi:hypothetical protein